MNRKSNDSRTKATGEAGKVINLLSERDYDNFNRILNEFHTFTIEKLEKPYLKRIFAVRNDNMQRSRNFGQRSKRQPWKRRPKQRY